MRRLHAVGAVAAVLFAYLLAGCGVPTDRRPRPLSEDAVPFGLLDATSTTTTAVASPSTAPVEIFLVREDRLVPVARNVAALSPATAVAQLVNGPTPEERAAGLRTAIAAGAGADVATTKPGTVRLDLDESFIEMEGPEQILALAQLLFTATSLRGVEGVVFTLAGKPVEVPTADGTLRTGVLRRDHFDSLLARRGGGPAGM